MIRWKRTTAPDGIPGSKGPPRIGVARTLRAWLAVARSPRVEQWPTRAQLRTMAALEGRAPASYRLDGAVNALPEALPSDFPHGAVGLRFAHGVGQELVALPNGWGFTP